MDSPDVIIAGAGIIGVSIALELCRRGVEVLVLDRGAPGQEASSAAAGMLAAAAAETPEALRPLGLWSARLFPEYVQRLESDSGMKVDYRRQGAIVLREETNAPAHHRQLSPRELEEMEPALTTQGRQAFFVAEASVDPVLLVHAALCAAARNRIDIRGNTEVRGIRGQGSQVEIVTASGTLSAPAVVNCRGAWSGAPVKPRKGQALYLQPQEPGLLEHVVAAREVYLVPRSSGKIFVGATVEDAGYDKTVDPETIRGLREAAARFVPKLASAPMVSSWAGLRPGSPDDLPLLGQTATPGIFTAGGHFRNGILLAPATARVLADLVTGRPAELDISAFSPLRFA